MRDGLKSGMHYKLEVCISPWECGIPVIGCANDPVNSHWILCWILTEAAEAERKKASQTDSVESYEAAFDRIREITGEEDTELLVHRFIEVEDKNFALFNYVNEQNNDIELMQEQILEVSTVKCLNNDHQIYDLLSQVIS